MLEKVHLYELHLIQRAVMGARINEPTALLSWTVKPAQNRCLLALFSRSDPAIRRALEEGYLKKWGALSFSIPALYWQLSIR